MSFRILVVLPWIVVWWCLALHLVWLAKHQSCFRLVWFSFTREPRVLGSSILIIHSSFVIHQLGRGHPFTLVNWTMAHPFLNWFPRVQLKCSWESLCCTEVRGMLSWRWFLLGHGQRRCSRPFDSSIRSMVLLALARWKWWIGRDSVRISWESADSQLLVQGGCSLLQCTSLASRTFSVTNVLFCSWLGKSISGEIGGAQNGWMGGALFLSRTS